MRPRRLAPIVLRTFAILAATAAICAAEIAEASTLKTIYSFCARANCADGQKPGGLLLAADGTFYGTTAAGGETGFGTVFSLTSDPGKTKWKLKRLHSFCAKSQCRDGQDPEGNLIIDTFGNLYGTTHGEDLGTPVGTVFALTRDGAKWNHRIIVNFSHRPRKGGDYPVGGLGYRGQESGLPYDGVSTLYGTNTWGGHCGLGTVFQFAPNGGGGWDLGKSYSFCGGANGYNPWYGVVADDASGDLYGTDFSGGGTGAAYKLHFDGTRWTQTILHVIGNPVGPLAMDGSGFLYGVSNTGGAHNGGFAFRVSTDGSQYAVLYDFCAAGNCSDGQYPAAGLIRDSAGNLYGTTSKGGAHDAGEVFRLSFNGSAWEETVLHDFCSLAQCKDGGAPFASLVLDPAGNLYGTTLGGGRFGGGTAFELTP